MIAQTREGIVTAFIMTRIQTAMNDSSIIADVLALRLDGGLNDNSYFQDNKTLSHDYRDYLGATYR